MMWGSFTEELKSKLIVFWLWLEFEIRKGRHEIFSLYNVKIRLRSH